MNMIEWIASVLLITGSLLFVSGSFGLIRLPGFFAQLHALTKVDNLGLGMLCWGVLLLNPGWTLAVKLLLIWLMVVIASTVSSYLLSATRQQKEHES